MKHIHRIRSTRLVSNRVLEPQHDSFLQESQLTERSGATGATLAGHVPLSRRWGTSLRALLLLVAISALLATTPAHSQTTPTGFTVSNYATNLPGSGGVTNMAIDTATRTIYYAEANSNSGTAFVPLFKLAPNRTFTTVTTQMGLFGFNPYIATDLEFFEGGVYFVSDSGNAVRIDVTTGTVTKLATLFGSGDESGCVIRNGVLYATDGTGTTNAVKSLNLTTLAQTTLASAIPSLSSTLEYNAIRDSYYFMDVGGGRLMKMTPAGAVSPVANLGTSAYNFAIEPSGAAAYVRANGSTTVLRVDLTTGVVTTFVTGLATTSLTDLVMGPSSTGTTWSLYIGDGSRIVEVAGFAITQPPIADAGPDQTVNEGVFVTLDGTRSRDTNNPPKPLTYQWRQTDGVQVTLLNPSTVSPSFTAPSVPLEGAVLKFELSVSNGVTTPATDIVIVNVVNVNTPPTANAGSDQTVPENSLVTLSGSGSDPDGDPLIPTWTQTGSPTVVLSDTNTATLSFIAPPVSSAQGTIDLTFCLTVNDGFISSGPSCVTVHVFNTNAPPIANAGIDQSVNELDLVTLDGTHSSDPNGDTLTYSWAQVGNPPIVALSGADTATPSFTTPELLIGGVPDGTTLTFQLTVSDGELSSTGIVNVRVRNVNHPPLVDAGTDQTVPERSQVTLHGENSGDPDGDTLTYAWVQTGGTPQVELTDATAAMASFTAPDVGVNGDVLTFRLTVNDGATAA